jgi:dynactin complex subunit
MTDIITDVEAYRLLLRQLGEAQAEVDRLTTENEKLRLQLEAVLTAEIKRRAEIERRLLLDRREVAAEIKQLRAESETFRTKLAEQCGQTLVARGKIARLMTIIAESASEGTYDEAAIRKAVSFELAELIVEAHAALERRP